MPSIVRKVLRGDVVLSQEELDAEAEVVAELDAAPAIPDEELDAVDDAEAADEESSTAATELANLQEATTSLEELANWLAMESAPLTAHEYNLVMSQANNIMRTAGFAEEGMSFEADATDATHDRGQTKDGLMAKAKGLGAAVVKGIKALLERLSQWWDLFFGGIAKSRARLVAMAKAYSNHSGNEFSGTLPASLQPAMDDNVPTELAKAYQLVMVDYVKHLGYLAFGAAQRIGVPIEVPNMSRFKLPGQPNFAQPGPYHPKNNVIQPGEVVAASTFKVAGSVTGEGKETFEVSFGKSFARTDIGNLIRYCDLLSKSHDQWKEIRTRIIAEMDKQVAGKTGPESWVAKGQHQAWLSMLGNLYDCGPKRFVKYSAQVLLLRARGYAKILESSAAPAAQTGAPAGASDQKLLNAPA